MANNSNVQAPSPALLADPQVSPLLVDEPSAARLLGGISTRTLARLAKRGDIKALKIGSRKLYNVETLRQFIGQREGGAL